MIYNTQDRKLKIEKPTSKKKWGWTQASGDGKQTLLHLYECPWWQCTSIVGSDAKSTLIPHSFFVDFK
jgi:hypothetical protein